MQIRRFVDFLAYGEQARDAALETVMKVASTVTDALTHEAVPEGGIGAFVVGPSGNRIQIEREPAPDALSGDGSGADSTLTPLCLGKKLQLQLTLDPLFHRNANGDPIINDGEHRTVRQGNLKNCPLAACLVAMARSPGYRQVLTKMIRDVPTPIFSTRQPALYESCPSGPDPPEFQAYSDDHHFVVAFRRRLTPTASVNRPGWLGRVVQNTSVIVSTALYRDTRHSPPLLHYAHIEDIFTESSAGQPIWPAIIEKAYAVAKGNNSYEGLNNFVYQEHADMHEADPDFDLPQGLDPIDVMRDVAGPSTVRRLAALSNAQLKTRLRSFERRPIVLDTRDDLPADSIPPPDHAMAVVDVADASGDDLVVTIFDALNGTRQPFNLDTLRATFANIFQVNAAR
jgi:hypothetical protein